MLNSSLFRFQDFQACVEPRALDNRGLGERMICGLGDKEGHSVPDGKKV